MRGGERGRGMDNSKCRYILQDTRPKLSFQRVCRLGTGKSDQWRPQTVTSLGTGKSDQWRPQTVARVINGALKR